MAEAEVSWLDCIALFSLTGKNIDLFGDAARGIPAIQLDDQEALRDIHEMLIDWHPEVVPQLPDPGSLANFMRRDDWAEVLDFVMLQVSGGLLRAIVRAIEAIPEFAVRRR